MMPHGYSRMTRNLPFPDRIAADIDALAAITEPDRPYTRRAFTPDVPRGPRALAAQVFRAAGLETRRSMRPAT